MENELPLRGMICLCRELPLRSMIRQFANASLIALTALAAGFLKLLKYL